MKEETSQSIPFYIRQYIVRRLKYCKQHLESAKVFHCEDCKALQLRVDKFGNRVYPPITLYEVMAEDERGEMLRLAAILEYRMGEGRLTVPEARYQLIEQYPHTNHIPYSYFDKSSVLHLIIPYFDSVHGKVTMTPLKQFYMSHQMEYV